MEGKFSVYLREIDASQTMIQRVMELIEMYESILPKGEIIKDIFVEEYFSKTKEHEFLSLFFFTDKFQAIIPNFLNMDSISIYPSKGMVDYISIQNTNYDLKEAKRESEMTVVYSLGVIVEMTIHATGKNCDILKEIIQTYLNSGFSK